MKLLGHTGHVTVAEMSTEIGDPKDALLCRDHSGAMHASWYTEEEDAQAFLNHLYDHRLRHNHEVPQKAIDEIYQRLQKGRRFATRD